MTTVSSKGVFLPQTGTHEKCQAVTRTKNKTKPQSTSDLQPTVCVPAEAAEMENMRELIPFAKEMLSQKPTRGMLKVYLVGSVFAVLGTVIGLVEAVCHPFCSGDTMDTEMVLMLAKQQRTVEAELQHSVGSHEEDKKEEEEEEEKEEAHENGAMTQTMTFSKTPRPSQRSIANRLHAS